jgi:hypothetical protein
MANGTSGVATQSYSNYRESVVNITGIAYNAAGGSNYNQTPSIRARAQNGGSFVVSGTWATSTSATLQLVGSNDNVSWVALGGGLSASSGTVPQAGSISGDGFDFVFYAFQLTGGDSGTALAVQMLLGP